MSNEREPQSKEESILLTINIHLLSTTFHLVSSFPLYKSLTTSQIIIHKIIITFYAPYASSPSTLAWFVLCFSFRQYQFDTMDVRERPG